MDSSESFHDELKKHCNPAVDETKYQAMIEEQLEKLKQEKDNSSDVPSDPTIDDDERQVLKPVEKPDDVENTTSNNKLEDMKDQATNNANEQQGRFNILCF